MISIQHLKKEYPDAAPLIDINAEIDKGEVISVIGPSGTGKSTLLRCINRLEKPTSGRIFIDGEEITAKKCKIHLLRRKMGMVFQSFNLFPNLTVMENIMKAPMDLLKTTKSEAQNRSLELLRRIGLSNCSERYPDELSGGQKQRVAIARTLAMGPEIILFDEPTSALDPTMVGEVLAVIRNLTTQKLTMLIVTHEMQFARDVSTRVFYLDEGVIYEEGTPEQIFEQPRRDRTRRFIAHLQAFEENIRSRDFDFIGLNSRIEAFGRRVMMDQKTILGARTVFEELCVQKLLPLLSDPVDIRMLVEYSERTADARMRVYYNGGFDPTSAVADLPMLLVERVSLKTQHFHEPQSGYTDCIEVCLK